MVAKFFIKDESLLKIGQRVGMALKPEIGEAKPTMGEGLTGVVTQSPGGSQRD
jgi:hypothetical protein